MDEKVLKAVYLSRNKERLMGLKSKFGFKFNDRREGK